MFIEQSDQSCEFAPEVAIVAAAYFRRIFQHLVVRCMKAITQTHRENRPETPEVTLRVPARMACVDVMTALRELRRAADLSQQELAALLGVPVNTFRMWDSGLRPVPVDVLPRAKRAVSEHARNSEPLSLDQLAMSSAFTSERCGRQHGRDGRG